MTRVSFKEFILISLVGFMLAVFLMSIYLGRIPKTDYELLQILICGVSFPIFFIIGVIEKE